MLSVPVHKDVTEYQPKVIGGLTARTIICIGAAVGSALAFGMLCTFVFHVDINDVIYLVWLAAAPAEDKPCISELFENDVLDMELVGKIAHNELDKQKGFPFSSVSANSIRALASEYIDSYANDLGIIEAYATELDSHLSAEDYRGGKISPEFMLGCAIGLGAASHANADIDYFSDKFSSRAVIEIEELGLSTLRSECRSADDFSLAGVNPDTKFPIGFVSVRDVVDAVDEFGSEHMKETLAPADMERVASSLAEAEQCIERYELADGITFNAELEMEKIDCEHGEQGLDDICDVKSEEADLVADSAMGEREAPDNEQDK